MPPLRGPDRLDPGATRALAERLISIPSASPDPAGESRCARALLESFPEAVERGVWRLRDRREVVWARLRGGSSGSKSSGRALLLLGHHDTVGVSEYARLGAPEGALVAFQPHRLREVLEERAADVVGISPEVLPALRDALAAGDDWVFGRGALDMKSGLAAAVAALRALADEREELRGDVLFVSCPDEEHESAGMIAAVGEIARLRNAEGLELVGALNLDYGEGPVGYAGVMGKLLLGVYVLGASSHAAAAFEGVDAAQLAAVIVHRLTTSMLLSARGDGTPGPPPVALRLRDLKTGYNAQTADEAFAEINLMSTGRRVQETLAVVRRVIEDALEEFASHMEALQPSPDRVAWPGRGTRVLSYAELAERAGEGQERHAPPHARARKATVDARDDTLARVRKLARAAGLHAPAVVLYLAPPFHPHIPPGDKAVTLAAFAALVRAGQKLESYYPFISDASYLAWRAESPEELARNLPALGAEYTLPAEDSRSLGLEVVNIGPWGRDAHGLCERVYAPYAFETLPRLIAEIARETLAG